MNGVFGSGIGAHSIHSCPQARRRRQYQDFRDRSSLPPLWLESRKRTKLSASALFPQCAWGAFCHHAATLSGAYQPRSKTDLSQTPALSGQGKSDTVFEELNLRAPAELEREEYCPLSRLNALPFMIFRRRHAASQRSTAHSAATCCSRPALGSARCSSAFRPFSHLSHQLLSVNSLGLVSSALAPAQFACGRKLCAAGLAMVLNNPGFCCRLHVRHCRWWKIIPGKVESCSSS